MRQLFRRRWFIFLLVVAIAAAAFAFRYLRRPPQVDTVLPVKREVVELVVATGYLRAAQQTDISSDLPGIVDEVRFREGDFVRAGDAVVILRQGTLESQVEYQRSSLERARAEQRKASRPAYPEDIALARTELRRALEVNRAAAAAARERLSKLEAGGRPEERRAAEAQLASARSAREHAESDLKRAEELFRKGAVARAELDSRRAAAQQARAAEEAAQQALAIAVRPARDEDVAAAAAEVRAAEATLRTSVAAARQRLSALLQQPRAEDVRIARARTAEAEAALRRAETELTRTVLRAPFDGVLTSRGVEPGEAVSPAQPLAGIADLSTAEIRVETDETNLQKLRLGQTALVFAPAYPENPFKALLTRIGPAVDRQRGVVELQLIPRSIPSYLRPDMTLDVNLEVTRLPDALALPITSVLQDRREPYVLIPRDGKAAVQEVTVLASNSDWVAVDGIPAEQQVIFRGDSIRPGDRISTREVDSVVR